MDKSELKRIVCERIDAESGRIFDIADRVFAKPEMGYREFETSKVVKEELERLGIPCESGLAVTGVKGNLKGRGSRARVAVIGELDAVTCAAHPGADPITGATHACGHNIQIAAMLGAAMGLSAVANELDGDVCFFATPAEEYAEMGYRESLRAKGDIEFFGGKQELIRIGAFDDIDMAMMVHAQGADDSNRFYMGSKGLGFVAKTVDFLGKAAHAAAAPHEGINALNAAMAAMMCIHAQRETFRDEDSVRVHPIITNGGDLVNVVPDKVTMETYVRAASRAAMLDASAKVDRAIEGAAHAIGARCEIHNHKGYLPLLQSEELSQVFASNAGYISPPPEMVWGVNFPASTDIGDLGHIMPIIQPMGGGYRGSLHSAEFAVDDAAKACLNPAKLMAMAVIDLLSDGAERALEIKKNFKPALTKEEYINS